MDRAIRKLSVAGGKRIMNMPLLKVKEYDPYDQYKKIKEEFNELESVDVYSDSAVEDEISEALDLITATFTMLTHEHSKDELKEAIEKHCNKLKSRGWETKGTIKIELEDEE
jgi:hypothetical protein